MKKFIAAILAICIISGITVISYAESYYGDLDGNGTVNSADALAILQYTVGLKKSIDTKAADVNHDGKVNSSDALAVLQISVGKQKPEKITTKTTGTTKPTYPAPTQPPKTTIAFSGGKYEVHPTSITKYHYASKIEKAWLITEKDCPGLRIEIARIVCNKTITQNFTSAINKQIVNPKTITYHPTCSVALITCKDATALKISKGTALDNTESIAKNVGAFIAINGRQTYDDSKSATVRDGAIYRKYTGTEGKAASRMVFYKDGTWKLVNNFDNTTAAAEIKKGAWNSTTYQGGLQITNGVAANASGSSTPYRNRTYLGKISPTKYVFMTTEFMPANDAAEVLLSYGVKDAIQINGGNCTQMYVKNIGNTTGSTGASVKGLNKVGYLETEWYAKNGMLEAKKGGGPCSHEYDVIYFK